MIGRGRFRIRRLWTRTDPPIPEPSGPYWFGQLTGNPIVDLEKISRRIDTVEQLGTFDRSELGRIQHAIDRVRLQVEWDGLFRRVSYRSSAKDVRQAFDRQIRVSHERNS